MYVVIAPIEIKAGYKEQYVKELIDDARDSLKDEPGCLRFDIIQDAAEPNRIWLYEVFKDQAAFQAHTQTPQSMKFRDATKGLRVEGGLQGAGQGAANIWPPNNEWK